MTDNSSPDISNNISNNVSANRQAHFSGSLTKYSPRQLNDLFNRFNHGFTDLIEVTANQFNDLQPFVFFGRVVSAHGTIIQANLPQLKVGDLCLVHDDKIGLSLYAEVVAINGSEVKLLPYGNINNISQMCLVSKLTTGFAISVGDSLLSKIINGFGEVMADLGSSVRASHDDFTPHMIGSDTDNTTHLVPVFAKAPDPLQRPLIDEVFVTGVKAIDMFNTCGVGQRVGVFAPPGVGKTTLMGMIIRNCEADVVVVALIGERGREVREFIDLEISPEIRQKCIIVAATSDKPPVEQVKCAFVAQTVAEYFRDKGKKVLLFMDSITRFARAQREVGLSAGEPITRGGFPPSVFLSFPRLMERAGSNQYGSVTAFYTVLTEDDDAIDAIGEECKSILDGHIILSRSLAEKSQYPAINVLSSLSRVADRIITPEHLERARYLRMLLAEYQRLEFVVRIGEYTPGQNELSDKAINNRDGIMAFLRQTPKDKINFEEQKRQLNSLVR